METGVVPLSEVMEKGSLRATDYLPDNRLRAKKLVKAWNDHYLGLINLRSVPSKLLIDMIRTSLDEVYELGKKRGGK
jgi:hypothetical protein